MYCSACGKTISDGLNYCNTCGSRIEKNPLVVENASSRLFAAAAGAIAVVGLICFIPLLQTLLRSQLDQSAMIVILALYLATVLLMFSILVGHVWKNSGDIRIRSGERLSGDDHVLPRSLPRVNTSELEPLYEQPISVTENTTRTLDEATIRAR